jgi:hypothetical protein
MLNPKINMETIRGISARLTQHNIAVKTTAATAAMAWDQPRKSGFTFLDNGSMLICDGVIDTLISFMKPPIESIAHTCLHNSVAS